MPMLSCEERDADDVDVDVDMDEGVNGDDAKQTW